MAQWQIGDVSVTRVVDIMQDIDLAFLIPEATPENLAPFVSWLKPHSIIPFMVASPTRVITIRPAPKQ